MADEKAEGAAAVKERPAAAEAAAAKPAKKAAPKPEKPARGKVVEHPSLAKGMAANRARMRPRHWIAAASFMLCVVAPSAAAIAYLHGWAADQYGSYTAFSVRSGEAAAPTGLLGALTQSVATTGVDAEIIYDLVRSQQMVEAAMAALPLERMFGLPEDDALFRLSPGQPIETVVRYWNRMTDVSFDSASGIVRFEARAFTPDDAQAITSFVLDEATRVVNDLSDQAQADAISIARQVLTDAEARLREARAAVRRFRDVEQGVDPSQTVAARMGVVSTLEGELAATEVELRSVLELVGPRSPRVGALRQRIASLQTQLARERERIGAGADGDGAAARRLSSVVSDYENLEVDREFAQTAYLSALNAFEVAQIDARRQARFLAPHISPTRSIAPQYPQRTALSAATFGLALVLWMVGLLVAYNLRDRH